MNATIPRILKALCITSTVFAISAAAGQQMPRTTTENVKGQGTVATQKLSGTVIYVEGNDLVVGMSTGEVRNFVVPESRRFLVDGKDLTVSELKPGTKLTATVTTTTTPVTERTTTIGTGKVWFVSGNTVILTLPNNENRMYKVNDNYRFTVGGEKASVHDLRKGMTIAAEKIVESPKTEIASDVAVIGHAPPAPQPKKMEVARAPARVAREETPAPAPAAAPTPAPVSEPAAPIPAELPKTGSPIPLVGLLGSIFIVVSRGLRSLRRT